MPAGLGLGFCRFNFACRGACAYVYCWAFFDSGHNRLAYIAHGNGAGGSRTTAHKRNERNKSTSPTCTGLNLDMFAQLIQLMTLLQTVFSRLNTGIEGRHQCFSTRSGRQQEQKEKESQEEETFSPPAGASRSRTIGRSNSTF